MLDVSDFVALEDVDPIYYDRTYWLVPDGEGAARAYRLLLAAMEDEQRVGIGTVVMRNKQYLTAIRPLEGALAMSTHALRGRHRPEVGHRRHPPQGEGRAEGAEAGDADHRRRWPRTGSRRSYKDTYTDELRKRIDRKAKGKDVVDEAEEQERWTRAT